MRRPGLVALSVALVAGTAVTVSSGPVAAGLRPEPLHVVARLDRPADAPLLARLARAGVPPPTGVYSTVPLLAITLTAPRLTALRSVDGVQAVEPDGEWSIPAVPLSDGVTARDAAALRDSGISAARRDFGTDGDGGNGRKVYGPSDAVIAVIDSGIRATHVALDEGKVLGFYNAVDRPSSSCAPAQVGETAPFDDNGHGTLVASVAAGDGDGSPDFEGAAPGAALVGVKVLDCRGSGRDSDLVEGIDWVVANRVRFGIEVVNLSLGGPGRFDDAVAIALNTAVAAGLTVVVAAGNDGPEARTVDSPGFLRSTIAVGAETDPAAGGIALAPFSSRGPVGTGVVKPDIVAPGDDITGAGAGSNTAARTADGTSFSSPLVAGVAAMMQLANGQLAPSAQLCPVVAPGDCADAVIDASLRVPVRDLLTSTAEDRGPAGDDPDWGRGRLDAYRALAQAVGRAASNPPALPSRRHLAGRLNPGSMLATTITVTDPTFPLAAMAVQSGWRGAMRLELRNSGGGLLTASAGGSRQETVTLRTPAPGTYRLLLIAQSGQGDVWIDVSNADAATALAEDTPPAGAGGTTPTSAPPTLPPVLTTPASADGAFQGLSPARVLDTRLGLGAPAGRVPAGGLVRLQVAGAGGVPVGARAVALNVTVTEPTAAGFVTVWPCTEPRPNASSLNFVAAQTVANLVVGEVGPQGAVCLFAFAPAHLVADAVGWFSGPGSGPPTNTYQPLAPARLLDTRLGLGADRGKVPATGQLALSVVGRGGLPATGVTAVALNVTATEPDGDGFVTVWPCGQQPPTASNLNYLARRTAANLTLVPLGTDGRVCFRTFRDAHLVADVVGWFNTGGGGNDGRRLRSTVPVRVLDTRTGLGGIANVVPDGGVVPLTVLGVGGVPGSEVDAVVVNVTATEPRGDGFVTVYPCDQQAPTASTVNYDQGQTIPNLTLARVDPQGRICLQTFRAAHLVVDVVGWFAR